METLFTPTLADAFERTGMHLNGREPTPGRMVRFATNGSASDRAGWVRVFPDGDGAVFGCWRAGESYSWQRRDANAPPPSSAERAAARARADAERRESEQELERSQAKAAERAARIWSHCKPIDAQGYLTAKGVLSHGARLDRDGRLTLPVVNAAGDIQSLQFIDAEGGKQFLPDGKMKGGRLPLGNLVNGEPIVLAEGFATAASIRECTGLGVVVGFFGFNLKSVASDVRRQYPQSRLIVAGDLDANGKGREYAEAARIACAPSCAVYPAFLDGREKGDFNDLHQSQGADAVKRQIEAALAPQSRFRLLTGDDLANLPPLRWRIRDVLPETGLAAIFGASGSGKSFLVIDMAMAIAAGTSWFGHRVNSAAVTYCALEGEAGIAGRVAAFRSMYGASSDRVRYLLDRFNLLDAADVADLSGLIRVAGGGGGVVVLDTLNRAAPGTDENDSKGMGAVIDASQALQRELGGLVLLVHHTGKDASKGLRGHSSLHGALDAAIEVTRDHDRREWRVHKAKDGEDGSAHLFRLETVEIGEDDGQPVTSCIVQAETGDTIRRVLPPKSGNQRIVWDALDEPLRKSPHYGKAGSPPGRPCITIETAIEASRGRLVCEPKRQTERTQVAIRGLVDRGVLGFRDGWLWCA